MSGLIPTGQRCTACAARWAAHFRDGGRPWSSAPKVQLARVILERGDNRLFLCREHADAERARRNAKGAGR